MSARLIAATLALLAGLRPAGAQPVRGDVRAVGFRTPAQSGFALRLGQWCPILVELSAVGSAPQEVVLRCEQTDRDGDRVAYLSEPVTLAGDGPPRRLWCYAVMDSPPLARSLDLLDRRGLLVCRLDLPPFEILEPDRLLLLDLSQPPVTALRLIASRPDRTDRRYYRPVVVGRMPAAELPDRWWGLEAVDVIVWDEPRLDANTISSRQLAALIEWVRRGGELVVGLGASWPRVRNSALGRIIPLRGDRAPATTRVLENFLRNLSAPGVKQFPGPISLALARAVPGALRSFSDRLSLTGPTLDLVVSGFVGSGRVTAVAASLRELTSVRLRRVGPANTPALFLKLFDLNPHTPEFLSGQASNVLLANPAQLLPHLARPTEFGQRAGLLMLAAVAFVTLYLAVSTLVSWAWLRRRGLTRLSWPTFAACAVLASFLSLGAVGLTRGVFSRVRAVSLIDLTGGASEARATCLFGHRSPTRRRVALSLPGAGNYLRALASGPGLDSRYATPARYTALASDALLRDVLMRATLKQFEGFWQGTLAGTVRAQLVARRDNGRITPASWIRNELSVDLAGGYLLYLDPRLPGQVDRAAGHTEAYRPDYRGSAAVPPAINVLALRLDPLPAGQQLGNIGAQEYAEYERAWTRWRLAGRGDPQRQPQDLPTLWHRQRQWTLDLYPALGITRSGLGQSAAAALLASTRGLYLPSRQAFDKPGRPIATAGLVDRDISCWLVRGQAVLLLWAEEPGPATLHVDGEPLPALGGASLYRVRVPLGYAAGAGRRAGR